MTAPPVPARLAELEYERLLAVLSAPDYDDGPELPLDQQCDPDDPGLWVIWEGGPIKAGADLSGARANRAWQAIRDAGGHPERGDGMKPRGVERVALAGGWGEAL